MKTVSVITVSSIYTWWRWMQTHSFVGRLSWIGPLIGRLPQRTGPNTPNSLNVPNSKRPLISYSVVSTIERRRSWDKKRWGVKQEEMQRHGTRIFVTVIRRLKKNRLYLGGGGEGGELGLQNNSQNRPSTKTRHAKSYHPKHPNNKPAISRRLLLDWCFWAIVIFIQLSKTFAIPVVKVRVLKSINLAF